MLFDGHKLATEALHDDRPGKFWDRVYQLPAAGQGGKKRGVVRFAAHPGNFAGGVFGVRVVRRAAGAP